VLVYALGGLDAERASECARAGAHGVAAIRSMWSADGAEVAARIVSEVTAVAAMRTHPR
jgi:thiamine monophosphate synthase